MEFVRRKKRGQNHKVRRTWFSEEGYRIVWRKEVHGVRVPARFQTCVRVLVPYSDGELRQMWDFVNHKRRLIKTLAAAQEECEKHYRLWVQACEATGIRALKELFGGKLPSGLPVWARKKLDRRLYAILTDNRPSVKYRDDEEDESCTESSQPASDAPGPGGPIKTTDSSASPTEATSETATPASPAEDKAESTTRRTRRAQSKGTSMSDASTAPPAPPAEEAAKARKKPAARRTGKASTRTAKRKTSMTGSSASGARRSKGLRGTKSVPCGS
jgi:hypothetical protein